MKCGDCGNTHTALPGFPNHVLCNYYHLHMSNIADASRCEHFKPNVQTNADRIRNMTDEDLAILLSGINVYPWCAGPCRFEECLSCVFDWLIQEAE